MVLPHQDDTLFPQMLLISYVTLFESKVAGFAEVQVGESKRDFQAVSFPKCLNNFYFLFHFLNIRQQNGVSCLSVLCTDLF